MRLSPYTNRLWQIMRKLGTEFCIGIGVWALEVPISYGLWFAGNEVDILMPVTPLNIVVVACLFLAFLVGFLISHGFFQFPLKRSTQVLGLVLSMAATLGLSLFFFFGMVGLMAMMVIIQLTNIVDQTRGLIIAVAIPALFVAFDTLLGKNFDFTEVVVYGIVNLLAILTSYGLVAEQKAKLEAEQLVRELKATQILLSATTKRDERLRIARDLHDALGHQLTALSLQLEVASHVSETDKQKHILQAQKIGGSLLYSVRETVSEIRQKRDMDLRDALTALIQGVTGITVKVKMDLDESMADARQMEVIFRCVQEALTNTVKHSAASECEIELSSTEEYFLLSVKDNGSNTGEVEAGNGLKGMTERVASIDGELTFNNSADGFVLNVKLPIHG
jgi:signal transduction histidine kinase